LLKNKKTLAHPKADPERRSVFCQEIKKHKEKSRSLVFIDESGFAHDMTRTHGYSAKGSRCFGGMTPFFVFFNKILTFRFYPIAIVIKL
jgi:hypothetical protein